jgi:hypothetical protein
MQAQTSFAAALTLRPYQREAIEAARRRFRLGDSRLARFPRGVFRRTNPNTTFAMPRLFELVVKGAVHA